MSGLAAHGHEAVMVGEVLGMLALEPGEVVLDCTMGRGGHAVEMARRVVAAPGGAGGGMVVGMDVDPENLQYARKRVEEAGAAGAEGKGLRTFEANFAEAEDVLAAAGIARVDGLLADLGVSTNQLMDAKHGLSFNTESLLDMRLDPRIKKKASDLLAEWDEARIAAVLRDYAQERFARRIARKIIQSRAAEPILTTGQLARLVRSIVPGQHAGGGSGGRGIDPATRTFQALRMAVNGELDALQDLLTAIPRMMKPRGRAVLISFHSGEDRLVKQAMRAWETRGICEILTKRPAEPSAAETARNPRSRSAKLRAARFLVAAD